MIQKVKVFITAAILLLTSAVLVVAHDREGAALQLITDITENATVILTSHDKPLEERENEFHRLLKKHINFSFIAVLVMGTYWTQMNEEQKLEFVDLFSDFFLKSYAPQFGGYPGEKILNRRVRKNGAADVFIKLDLHRPKRKPTTSEWRVREFGGIPRIIDLTVAEVSVVISHRKGFHQHLNSKGVEGLLTLLRIRADRLSAQP